MDSWVFSPSFGYSKIKLLLILLLKSCLNICFHFCWVSIYRASLVAQSVKNLPAMQESQVWFLGWEDSVEKEMTTNSIFLPGESHGPNSLAGYSPWGRPRVRHNLATEPPPNTYIWNCWCMFNILRNWQMCFPSDLCHFYIPVSKEWEFHLQYILDNTWYG